MTGKTQTPLVIILGATAIGKTQLAIDIARVLNGEIIGADSRQIYTAMDIGTAKPTNSERCAAPHHLVDFLAPDADFTLAQYQDLAYQAIADVTARGKLPLLVGGTGQYLTAVEEGWSIPRVPPNAQLRAELQARADTMGVDALHADLVTVDPEAALRIHPNNIRRVIRALEVHHETGTPISILQRKQAPPYRIRVIGLQLARDPLYARADARVEQMIAAGFVQEVEQLLGRGYGRDLPSMTALGYREMVQHVLDALPLDEAIQRTKHSTHNFIRRQEAWFRGHDNGILWHNMVNLNRSAVIADLREWLQEY